MLFKTFARKGRNYDKMKESSLKSSAFSGFIWKFAERICAQMVSMVVSIVLARLLLPEDYAVVGIVSIFFTFCNVFISGGLGTALIQKKNADMVDYSTILHISMIVAALIYVVMFFFAPYIAKIYEIDLLIPVIRVMGLTFFINAFKSVLCAYTSNNLQFKKFFLSTIVGTIVSAFVGIFMAKNGFGAWSLVAQQMTNSFMDTVILYFTTKFKVLFVISWKRFKRLFSFGWKLFVSSIISVIYDQINPLIVGVKFKPTDLSYYTKGKSFPSLIDSTINNTLSAVLFPVISKVQDEKTYVLNITRKYIKTASYLIFPIMCGFFAVSESFVKILLTEKWFFAVPYMQIFCFSYMFNIIQTGNLQAIQAIGRSDVSLILEIIKKSCYFVVILAFVLLSDSPIMLAFSTIVCTVIATLVNTFPNRKLLGYKYRYQLMDIVPNLFIAILMGVVVLVMNNINISAYLLLPLQVIVGGILYVGLSLITKNENFYYLLSTIKQFLKKESV